MPNASVGAKRDPYWDALKFVLIFLVVYSHIVPFADYSRYKVAAFNYMYLFHMPLFGIFAMEEEPAVDTKGDSTGTSEPKKAAPVLSKTTKLLLYGLSRFISA